VAENLGFPCKVVPIGEEVRAVEETLAQDPEFAAKPRDVTEENIQARMRMLNIMAYCNKVGGLMVNTGNKTELILNNCTIYGDMTGGFSVLGDVDKDRVYALSRYINTRAGKELIPQSTIERVPSAELAPNQADENVMGAPPQIIAPYAREVFETGMTLTEALERFKGKLPEKAIRNIFVRSDEFEWKSRQMPPALRISSHAYGIGRRLPMNHGFYE
jgi:NAD+ synthetase